jgi:hypothetical protein
VERGRVARQSAEHLRGGGQESVAKRGRKTRKITHTQLEKHEKDKKNIIKW